MSIGGSASWSTQQLTELLALVSALPDGADVVQRALEHTVESIEGDVGAVIADGVVVASLGYAADAVPEHQLVAAAAGTLTVLDVPGAGSCGVVVVECDALPDGRMVLGRRGEGAFTSEERNVVRGLARVLSLALQARRTLEQEREQRRASEQDALHHQRLLVTLQERQTLLERLSRIQRSISTRQPLHEVLDAIVIGAAELLGDAITGLRLVDPDDPTTVVLAASHGIPQALKDLSRRSRVSEGVGGCAIATGALAFSHDYVASPNALPAFVDAGVQATMAAPVFQGDIPVGSLIVASFDAGRVYTQSEQEVLVAFAEHTGLALNDARTVAALHQAVSEATRQARQDSLTGLPNRAEFLDKLTAARTVGLPVGVLFIDLDDFKLVNDTLGHPVGDALLRVVGERISGSVRGGDVVARLGGDEFAVLLSNTADMHVAELAAERIRQALSFPFHLPGHDVSIGSSTGVVLAEQSSDESADDLLRDADVAMYRAKALGKGRSVLFAAAMRVDLQARSRLERELRRAIDHSELVVAYQPVIDVNRGQIVGAEALLRWHHPELGTVPPAEFIPVAEETGMILAIGRQVLLDATQEAAGWPGLSVSVNVSARQLSDGTIVRDVSDALHRSGLPAELLTLELTESVLVQDIETATGILVELKRLGVKLAIDDFGTGYSSLSYLAMLPVDVLKVDKAFVAGVGEPFSGGPMSKLAATVVALASTLGLETVVEGVETRRQLAAMRDLGCTLFQGYLWSAPVPAAEFQAMVTLATLAC
jgi:diguanylate cyclase (GGDEF)-like protein